MDHYGGMYRFFLGDQFNSGDVTNINVRHGYYGLLSSIP